MSAAVGPSPGPGRAARAGGTRATARRRLRLPLRRQHLRLRGRRARGLPRPSARRPSSSPARPCSPARRRASRRSSRTSRRSAWTAWSSRPARRSCTRTRSEGWPPEPVSTPTSTRRSTSASSARGSTPTTTQAATEKALGLVRAGIARTRLTTPLAADRRRDDAADPGHRWRRRRPAGRHRPGRHRPPGHPRRTRAARWAAGSAGFGDMYPHGRNGRQLIADLVAEVRQRPAITVLTGAEVVARSGSFGNYVVDIRVGSEGAGTISVLVGSIVVATGFEAYQPADGELGYGLPASSPWPSSGRIVDDAIGPLIVAGRPVRSRRLRLLRGQPPAARRRRRPRVLLTLLLHRRRPRLDRGLPPRPDHPSVPPLPRHAHVRQVRVAVHGVAQVGLGVPPLPGRRDRPWSRTGQRRPAGRDRCATCSRRARSWPDPRRPRRPRHRHGAPRQRRARQRP